MTNILIHKKKLQDCLFSYYLQLFISRQFWVNDNGGKTPTLVIQCHKGKTPTL